MQKSFLLTFFLFVITYSFGQRDTVKLRDIQKNQQSIVTDRAPQAIYFQIGGSGPILSVNYDRRFAKKVNGAGFAVGLGYFGISGIGIFSIPVSLNYLFGKNSHFIEAAAGASFVTATSDLFNDDAQTGSTFIYHVNLGCRYQPTRGGFFFRGGISPLFISNGYLTSYYIGFGHNF
ncbi:MAG: hypothetical protein ABIO55_00305 [Ginsengibacter sp.]